MPTPLLALCALSALATAAERAGAAEEHTYVAYSKPIRLRPAEVHNRVDEPVALPPELARRLANSSVTVSSFAVDVVEVLHGGRERSAPLYDAYNHHFIVFFGTEAGLWRLYNSSANLDPIGGACVKPAHAHHALGTNGHLAHKRGFAQFGGASGAEFRNNPHDIPKPYGFLLSGVTHMAAVLHLIGMRGVEGHSLAHAPLLECPCTPQRHVDPAAGTIGGCLPRPPFHCTDQLVRQRNGGCSLQGYTGGYRCCEHGAFLVDTDAHDVERRPAATYRLKFSLTFRAHEPARDVPLHATSCCDVTEPVQRAGHGFLGGNVEYDIPRCAEGTPPDACVHVATNVQPLDLAEKEDADELVELVHAAGHLHHGGIALELVDELTGQLVCRATPTYGASAAAGDEDGFLVGIQPCVWGPPPLPPPPRFKRSHPMRTIAYYNSSRPHTGVMSLWLMSAAVVGRPAEAAPVAAE